MSAVETRRPEAAAAWRDPRVPPREACVVRYLVDRWAEDCPDRIAMVFEGGEALTYAALLQAVRQCAAGLQALGVARDEPVAVWMPNGRDALIVFYAINYIGATFTPFNTAYRGRILEHVIDNSGARLLIGHADLLPRLSEVNRGRLEVVVPWSGGAAESGEVGGLKVVPFAELFGDPDRLQPLDRPIEPWDIQSIIYTSGTTGPSKGVLSSYLHLFTNAGPETWPMVTGDDRFLVASPIFHIGGMGIPFVMLTRCGSIAVMESFSTEGFWPFVRQTGCTAAFLLGVMATFLLKRPPAPTDRDHGLRLAFMVPLTEDSTAFHERFGVDIYTIFNMTEISSPIVSEANPIRRGCCGRPRPGVEVRLVDGNDCEVPVGAVGEMIVRTDRPFGMNSGYNRNPEATADAWRNGWFHTGDAFRRDEDDVFYFVDRVKDAIRRRGENISSFEVEAELVAHEDVREVAVIGVPSEFSEDEVMAVVAATPGRSIDPEALARFAADRLPYFMVPRYIRVLDELPKTPSSKVIKTALRAEGVTADTWDREKAGLRLKREGLAAPISGPR